MSAIMYIYPEKELSKELLDKLIRGLLHGSSNSIVKVKLSNSNQILKFDYKVSKHDLLNILISKDPMALMCETKKDMDRFDSKSELPIVKNGVTLFSDAYIADKIVYLYNEAFNGNISRPDEVIIEAYNMFGNIKDALENIIGGWSFIMIDQNIDKVYISTSFVPLAELYIPEIGYIVHSDIDTLKEVNKKYGNTLKSKLNEIEPYTITELGLFNLNDYHRYDYKHKFDHPIWSPDSTNKRLYIVLASSGLDSTALLTYLKYKNENVMPLYIDYASRVNDAERIAVEKICNKLGMELATIDLSPVFNKAKASSVLLDSSLDMNMVDLANDWVPNRNEMFISAASTLAESLILTNKYNNIIITGGVPTLGDQNEYSDCSQKFINSMNKTIRLSTLPGAYRYIKYKNPLRYLKKTEMVILINNINPDILDLIVSCNRPKVIDGEVYQCAKNGIPACYPGFENYIAYFKAGVTDKRKYYEVESDSDDEITKDITNFDNYTIEKIPSLLEILSKVK